MESTGKYYIPVYNVLEGFISNVIIANPKWVAVIKGEKEDNKDSKWIADLFKLGIVRNNFIAPKDFRILREYTRYAYKLTCNRTSKNRIKYTKNNFNQSLKQLLSFGLTSDELINLINQNANN